MVIEYVGELVRPSVADLRERRQYDALVGAGTYVFRLNSEAPGSAVLPPPPPWPSHEWPVFPVLSFAAPSWSPQNA